jgi:hypothetical protein
MQKLILRKKFDFIIDKIVKDNFIFDGKKQDVLIIHGNCNKLNLFDRQIVIKASQKNRIKNVIQEDNRN